MSHRFFFFLFSIYFNLIKFLQIEKKVEKDEFGGAGGRSERFRIAIASGGRFPSRWSSALYGRPATRLEKRISVARSSIGKHRFHQIHSRVKKIDFLKILFPFFFNSIFKKISGALDRICRLVSGPAMTWQLGFTTWASICTSANGNAGTWPAGSWWRRRRRKSTASCPSNIRCTGKRFYWRWRLKDGPRTPCPLSPFFQVHFYFYLFFFNLNLNFLRRNLKLNLATLFWFFFF